jgi:ATP-dependent exoDNAse (exonuclease V) alpha subunit
MFSKKACRLSVCFTNAKRKAVNDYWMNKEAINTKHLVIPAHRFDPNSQDMLISINTPIIARVSDAELEIANNETFVVKNIKKNAIILCNGLEIDKKDFNKYFYVAYCMTIHKSQGSSFSEEYTIYEWRMLDKRLRYVALSRATDIKNINIV